MNLIKKKLWLAVITFNVFLTATCIEPDNMIFFNRRLTPDLVLYTKDTKIIPVSEIFVTSQFSVTIMSIKCELEQLPIHFYANFIEKRTNFKSSYFLVIKQNFNKEEQQEPELLKVNCTLEYKIGDIFTEKTKKENHSFSFNVWYTSNFENLNPTFPLQNFHKNIQLFEGGTFILPITASRSFGYNLKLDCFSQDPEIITATKTEIYKFEVRLIAKIIGTFGADLIQLDNKFIISFAEKPLNEEELPKTFITKMFDNTDNTELVMPSAGLGQDNYKILQGFLYMTARENSNSEVIHLLLTGNEEIGKTKFMMIYGEDLRSTEYFYIDERLKNCIIGSSSSISKLIYCISKKNDLRIYVIFSYALMIKSSIIISVKKLKKLLKYYHELGKEEEVEILSVDIGKRSEKEIFLLVRDKSNNKTLRVTLENLTPYMTLEEVSKFQSQVMGVNTYSGTEIVDFCSFKLGDFFIENIQGSFRYFLSQESEERLYFTNFQKESLLKKFCIYSKRVVVLVTKTNDEKIFISIYRIDGRDHAPVRLFARFETGNFENESTSCQEIGENKIKVSFLVRSTNKTENQVVREFTIDLEYPKVYLRTKKVGMTNLILKPYGGQEIRFEIEIVKKEPPKFSKKELILHVENKEKEFTLKDIVTLSGPVQSIYIFRNDFALIKSRINMLQNYSFELDSGKLLLKVVKVKNFLLVAYPFELFIYKLNKEINEYENCGYVKTILVQVAKMNLIKNNKSTGNIIYLLGRIKNQEFYLQIFDLFSNSTFEHSFIENQQYIILPKTDFIINRSTEESESHNYELLDVKEKSDYNKNYILLLLLRFEATIEVITMSDNIQYARRSIISSKELGAEFLELDTVELLPINSFFLPGEIKINFYLILSSRKLKLVIFKVQYRSSTNYPEIEKKQTKQIKSRIISIDCQRTEEKFSKCLLISQQNDHKEFLINMDKEDQKFLELKTYQNRIYCFQKLKLINMENFFVLYHEKENSNKEILVYRKNNSEVFSSLDLGFQAEEVVFGYEDNEGRARLAWFEPKDRVLSIASLEGAVLSINPEILKGGEENKAEVIVSSWGKEKLKIGFMVIKKEEKMTNKKLIIKYSLLFGVVIIFVVIYFILISGQKKKKSCKGKRRGMKI